jgi:2-oxoglutarate ferredoxin oxidoreductase subunit alpha
MLEVDEISVLLGGKAGDGIRAGTTLLGRIIGRYGYRIFVYDDYPSIIRSGHNFSVLRASERKISANLSNVDVLLAFDKRTVENHLPKLKKDGLLIYDESNRGLKEYCESLTNSKLGLDIKGILRRI